MKPKEFLIPEELEDTMRSLIEMCKKTESPKDTAERIISEIANHVADSYYEVLGILQEASNNYREVFMQIIDEEEQEHNDKDAGVG